MRYENGSVDASLQGYGDLQNFFMNRSPGLYGAMLGVSGDLELPTPVFLDSIRAGMTISDSDSLIYLYGSVANFLGARMAQVYYDREGWPLVKMQGEAFPNTKVSLDMSFLVNKRMAWRGWVFSQRIVLPAWRRFDLEKVIEADRDVKLDVAGVYAEHGQIPEVAEQFLRYADLSDVIRELRERGKDPLVQAIEDTVSGWEGNWSVYSHEPPTASQQQVLDRYQVYEYIAEVNCFVPTLDEIVDQIKTRVPVVQKVYKIARETLGERV